MTFVLGRKPKKQAIPPYSKEEQVDKEDEQEYSPEELEGDSEEPIQDEEESQGNSEDNAGEEELNSFDLPRFPQVQQRRSQPKPAQKVPDHWVLPVSIELLSDGTIRTVMLSNVSLGMVVGRKDILNRK